MSQLTTYINVGDGAATRRYTGYPLNSTLVSSYTLDTIRSIINQAASGQPYSTLVWIQITRVGIQISAQDPQIATSRRPVFIPIGLVHDIFMQPNINNVICIVYDELQSRMKGVLLYVVHPNDAQLIREDFRLAKQGTTDASPRLPSNYSSPFDNRYSNALELVRTEEGNIRSTTYRQSSPRRAVYVREEDVVRNGNYTPNVRYTPSKNSYQSSKEDNGHRRRKSPRKSRRSSKERRADRSPSPEKPPKAEPTRTNASPELQQQQQQVAWQMPSQMPLVPMGIYNRYVPKTIPLPTGETLKTSLPPPVVNGQSTAGLGVAYIEPIAPPANNVPDLSSPPIPPSSSSRRNQVPSSTSKPASSSLPRTSNRKVSPARNTDGTEDLKKYLKALVDEMQALKSEMNKIQQLTMTPARKGRSDSIQIDLKQLRSEIDMLRTRMAMTPKLLES